MIWFFKKEREPLVKLLVGLGNPGKDYAQHRHNIGFMAIDAIADQYGAPAFKSKYQGLYTEVVIDGTKTGLLKPMTFMNKSGHSVAQIAKFYKLAPETISVFHDELDLEAGKVRVKVGGGNAGHNGLRSIEACIGTPNFERVRLGIGHPGDKARVHGYVLGNFSKEDTKWLETLLAAVAKEAKLLVKGNSADFMTEVSRAVQSA